MNACVRAAAEGKMRAVRYDGFWAPMDTLKERSQLEELYRSGKKPWALWSHENRGHHGRVLDKVSDGLSDGPVVVAI